MMTTNILIPYLNEVLSIRAKPYIYKDKGFRLKASSFGTKCLRKIVYEATKTAPDYPVPIETQKIFNIGDKYHELITEWLLEAGILISYLDPKTGKVPFNKLKNKEDPEFPIEFNTLNIPKGGIDGVLNLQGKYWLLENKSIKSSKFEKLTEPAEEHRVQNSIYYLAFRQNHKEGKYSHIPELPSDLKLEGVIYLYINKDSGEFKEFAEEFNPTIAQNVFKKHKNIMTYVENKQLPPKTPDYCNTCTWRDKCKKELNPL